MLKNKRGCCESSTSEMTIYQRAVPRVEPDVNNQIQQFIEDIWWESKAHLYEVPGKVMPVPSNPLEMDLDYQMIDSHVNAQMHKHIQCFEYINFSKLLSWSRSGSEDQRSEIINHNGSTYLSPVSDQETFVFKVGASILCVF